MRVLWMGLLENLNNYIMKINIKFALQVNFKKLIIIKIKMKLVLKKLKMPLMEKNQF